MADIITLGGSANLIADLEKGDIFELTGLDINGKVLQSINVQLVGTGLSDQVSLILPESITLNYREVSFNINRGDFNNTLVVVCVGNDTINGVPSGQKFKLQPQNIVQQVVLFQSTRWTISQAFIPA